MRTIRQARLPTDYAEQTHRNPYWIVRWPHEQRLRRAADAVIQHRSRILLDYGAGDSHILDEMVKRGGGWFPERVIAYEPIEEYAHMTQATVKRLGLEGRVDVKLTLDCDERFDFVTCLNVLEHMPLRERLLFYDVCQQGLTRGGRVLIDVPSEIGPTVVIKELARRAVKGRAAELSGWELLRYGLGAIQHDPQRWDPHNEATWIQFHTGFDHRLLREELGRYFRLIDSFSTPFPRLPAWLGNQEVFFLAECVDNAARKL